MEPHLSPYYYHHQHQPPTVIPFNPNVSSAVVSGVTTSSSQVTNGGILSNHGGGSADGANATALYPQSVAGKAPSPPLEIVRKKRGRPRKYGTPEAAAAAKRANSAAASSTSLSPPSLSSKKREQQTIGSPPPSSMKSQSSSEVNGQCFMPHVINVQPGEDVAQKIRIFVQQSSRELCILSASGSVCNVSLLQPATSGGSVTYDGSFDILSLSGSFVRTDNGEKSGGLSACLSASNGHIIGGGLAGPLIALGSVEVVVATFTIGTKKDANAGTKGDNSAAALASPTSGPVSTTGYRPVIEPSVRYTLSGVDDHQNMGGFMTQQQGLHMGTSHSDWRAGSDTRTGLNYDFTGRTGQGIQESPNNGDF
ncbi:hypothetical protein V2J09_007934 [Rumex salicifolius]